MNLPHLLNRQVCAAPVPIVLRHAAGGADTEPCLVEAVPKQACNGARRGPKPYVGELAAENRRDIHLRLSVTLVESLRAESRRRGLPFVVTVTALLVGALEGRGE